MSGQLPGGEAKPLSGVVVTVFEASTESAVASAETGAGGKYSLEVPSGVFDVRFAPASAAFESTVVHEVEVSTSRTLDVLLVPGKLVTFHLTGVVRDASGNPLPKIPVIASGGPSEASTITAANGSYSLEVKPGEYRLRAQSSITEAGPPSLPSSWSVETPSFAVESDQERDLALPPTSTLTVEALGKEDAPIPGAGVFVPELSSTTGGGLSAVSPRFGGESANTNSSGRASFVVFTASAPSPGKEGTVTPPAKSGFGATQFKVPQVEADTTVVVRFGGEVEDTEGPHLVGLSIEPESVNTAVSAEVVSLTSHITDDLSGFKAGTVTFRSPSGEQATVASGFKNISGTKLDGFYLAPAVFEQFSETGTWEIEVIRLTDNAGNETVLEPGQIEELELPHTVVVVGAQPPTVTEVSPQSGSEAGGTAVQISGAEFTGASEVRFGANAAAEFTVDSPSSITAVAPPGSGTVDVTVTTPAGTSALGPADLFRYGPPVALSSTPNPSTHGQKVTLTAKVAPLAPGAPTPLGTVAFVEGSTTLGVANLKKGSATFSTTALGAGKHAIVAEYSGDSYFGPAASEALTQTVAKASTQLTLASSLNPAPYGSSGTLKATVSAVAPGSGTPAGTITFLEGSTVLKTVQLSGASVTYSLKTLAPGAHEIVAVYGGDANNEPTESPTLTQQIDKAATDLSLTSSLNPAPYGSSATLKATVKTVAPGGGSPPGTVTFSEGSTVLAIVPVSAGVAKYALKTTAPGVHEITATYSGDSNYEASESSIVQTIAKATTELTLTSTKNPAPLGSSGTIKATVKAVAPGAGTPTGTVTFSEGETVLAIVPLSGNAATYPLKSLGAGTHEITATYNGSANYEASADLISQVIAP